MKIELILPDNTNAAKLIYGYMKGFDDGHVSEILRSMEIGRPKDGKIYTTEECK